MTPTGATSGELLGTDCYMGRIGVLGLNTSARIELLVLF